MKANCSCSACAVPLSGVLRVLCCIATAGGRYVEGSGYSGGGATVNACCGGEGTGMQRDSG